MWVKFNIQIDEYDLPVKNENNKTQFIKLLFQKTPLGFLAVIRKKTVTNY